jgi:two-component system response regulator FixJ
MAATQRDTVAIVDDDDAVRNSLRFLLEIFGHKVETFSRAAEFLKSELGHITCLILDHHMPEMTGLQLAAHLRAMGVVIPILLVTGAPSPYIVAQAAEIGVDRVLEKPPDDDEVLAFVEAAKG